MNTIGSAIRLSLFGESHGASVGCVIDGLPAGKEIDLELLGRYLLRRRAIGRAATARIENDEPQILSGLYLDRTNGAPLCAVFENGDAQPGDYDNLRMMRPSHADYPAYVKYGGHNDPRGGGMFSGRLTLPLVFAGGVAKQFLSGKGVYVGAHIHSIGPVQDEGFDPVLLDRDTLDRLDPFFPLVDGSKQWSMQELLEQARDAGDSVGGVVECAAVGLPAGVGEPFFDTLEGEIAKILFAIPGVKGVEFGAGFPIAQMRASEANDAFLLENGAVKTYTNHSGGINGGISNGMPILLRVALKPVPTIKRQQHMIDIITNKDIEYAWDGRHDACILPRGAVAVEAAVALTLFDAYQRAAT